MSVRQPSQGGTIHSRSSSYMIGNPRGTNDDELCDYDQLMLRQKFLLSKLDEVKQGWTAEKSPEESSELRAKAEEFASSFKVESERLLSSIHAQEEYLELTAKALLVEIDEFGLKAQSTFEKAEQLEIISKKAKHLTESFRKIQKWRSESFTIFKTIAAQSDEYRNVACGASLDLHHSLWDGQVNSAFIVVLSDIHEAMRAALKNEDGTNDEWVAPSSFERCTSKYWVSEENLSELLMHGTTHAPLLVYGRRGRLTSDTDCNSREGNKLWNELATRISSVYFDSTDMALYKNRIIRVEGARLLRARWYGEKPHGDQPIFLELKTHHEKWVATKSVKERVNILEKRMVELLSTAYNWDRVRAEALVLEAEPGMKVEDISKQTELLLTMKRMIIDLNLRPCVRSVYSRVAFQSPKDNSLRLTVDRHVTLLDETGKSPTSSSSWCLSDSAAISTARTCLVPYCVFEVKIAGSDSPNPVQELESTGIVVEATKFSKFLTGAAAFNADKVTMLPYWAEHEAFASLFPGALKKGNSLPKSNQDHAEKITNGSDISSTKGTDVSNSSGNTTVSSFFSSVFSNEKEKKVAAHRPARVDPKSYFANERTFIQWISAALLLTTVALLVVGNYVPGENSHLYIIGLCLFVTAAVIVVYATFNYHRRIKLLSHAAPYGYVDHLAPSVLAGAIVVGLLTLILYFLSETSRLKTTASLNAPFGHMQEVEGVCEKHAISGSILLETEPSDVVVDYQRNMLLVPSFSTISAYPISELGPDSLRRNPSRVLIDIPGADFESLTYVENRIFVASELPNNSSKIYILDWDSTGTKLEVSGSLTIPTAGVEGLAYVPSSADIPGRLYVGNKLGIIDVYQDPTENKTLTYHHRLNPKILIGGLVDPKVGALHYFEGLLYILHDNERVVRVWNILQGTMVAEWQLPQVGGGFDKQWEGLALERRTLTSGHSNIRSGDNNKNQLLLHLTLDSPPEVWTVVVSEEHKSGQIVLPSCASS